MNTQLYRSLDEEIAAEIVNPDEITSSVADLTDCYSTANSLWDNFKKIVDNRNCWNILIATHSGLAIYSAFQTEYPKFLSAYGTFFVALTFLGSRIKTSSSLEQITKGSL